jgi:hypothetical protein
MRGRKGGKARVTRLRTRARAIRARIDRLIRVVRVVLDEAAEGESQNR